jgi:phosphoribosyl-AMP cyclohydrolase
MPVAVQNVDTKEVILVAYTNEFAMKEAFKTRTLVLWSTSRRELWIKGKTSGETFELLEARVNCEQNSLLYIVRPRRGGICHTKNASGAPRNCYYRRIDFDSLKLENLDP